MSKTEQKKLRIKIKNMLVNEQIRGALPFPNLAQPPTKLALKLQERIKYMFGITVVPEIIRQPQSYYKTVAFRHLWEMRTGCNRYRIASFEKASDMGERSAWHVLDSPLFEPPDKHRIITKFIY